jgi:hypothetical protein
MPRKPKSLHSFKRDKDDVNNVCKQLNRLESEDLQTEDSRICYKVNGDAEIMDDQ